VINTKLTEAQKDTARQYAKRKWPDETVTVGDETNSKGEIVFHRLKVTTKPADKTLKISKKAK
jgi:hypothetical protein